MDITVVIINYQTPDFLEKAVRSFKKIYPKINVLLVDNGSADDSKSLIKDLKEELPETEMLLLDENIYHGPAMHFVLKNHITTEKAFFLDSDTETRKPGFLEKMCSLADQEKVYGVGQIITVNKRGFKDENGFEVLTTPHMLINTAYYNQFSPFIHHGQPTINNFREAQEQGLKFIDFPISNYIKHHWRGTANRFGYGLGLKSKVDYILNKLGM